MGSGGAWTRTRRRVEGHREIDVPSAVRSVHVRPVDRDARLVNGDAMVVILVSLFASHGDNRAVLVVRLQMLFELEKSWTLGRRACFRRTRGRGTTGGSRWTTATAGSRATAATSRE